MSIPVTARGDSARPLGGTNRRVSLKRVCFLIFLVALLIRWGLFFGLGIYRQPPTPTETENVAKSLATTGNFADPYKIPTGFTAHLNPVYPFLLSLAYRATSDENSVAFIRQVLVPVGYSLQFALVPLLALQLGIPLRVSVAASLFGALLPVRFMTELIGYENCLSVVLWTTSLMLTLKWWQSAQHRARWAAAAGLSWGIALLILSSLLVVYILTLILGIVIHWRQRASTKILHTSTIAVLVTAAVLSPWTVRNYVKMGSLFFIRDNFGLELSLSNHANVSPMHSENYYKYEENRHPFSSVREAELVREIGEVAYHRTRLREALQWITQNPAEFAGLTARRVVLFWFIPSGTQYVKDLVLYPITALGFFGLYQLFKYRRTSALIIMCGWVGFPLVYYLLHLMTRYRYPLEWSIYLMAAYALRNYIPKPPAWVTHFMSSKARAAA